MKEHKEAKTKTKSEAAKPIREHEPDSAGIDMGANEIWVAVPADRSDTPVRRFEGFTRDLMAIVQWLIQAAYAAWRWNRPESIGFRSIKCWRMLC